MKNLFVYLSIIFAAILVSFSNNNDKKIIVIDVGHGGKDNGVNKIDVLEKQITLEIANKIKVLNENPNIELLFTRDNDEFISIEDRVSFVNKVQPDYLISLHTNYRNDKEIHGVELYYNQNNDFTEASSELTTHIKSTLKSNMTIHKVAQANFSILKNANCPAVMIELGFLSNEKDYELLTSEEGQTMIAKNILASLK
jgi:N-acetylmuramoyl-L-alanine amidase